MAGTLIDLVNSVLGNAVLSSKLPYGRALVIFIGDNDTNPRHVAAYMPLGTETSEGAMRPGGDVYGSGNDIKVGGIHSYPVDDVDVDTDKQILIFEKGTNQDSGILGKWTVRRFVASDISDLDTDPTLSAYSDFIVASQKAVKDYVDANIGAGGFTSPMTAKGDLIAGGTAGAPTRLAGGSDFQYVGYDSTQSNGLAPMSLPVPIKSTVKGFPAAGDPIASADFPFPVTFPANFSGSVGRKLSSGLNPTGAITCDVKKNGTTIGTLTVSTSSVYTFATTGGVPITYNAGDLFEVISPGTVDATWSGFTFTFWGWRSSVASNGIVNPAVAWQGVWSNSTAYNLYEFVRYNGGVYICINPNTGNAPTLDSNNSYWDFFVGDGWNPRGIYNPATAYNPNDTVRYIATGTSYSSYRCKATTTGNLPTNATYWEPIAEAGIDGSVTPAQLQQQQFESCDDTGSANHIVVAPSPAFASYVAYQSLEIKVAANNTGATDINVSGLGTKSVINADGSALSSGTLKAGGIYRLTYNGIAFQLIGAGASGGNLTAKYIIGATDATLSNARVWPGLYNHPDAPPAVANAMDDEFDAGSLDPKWSFSINSPTSSFASSHMILSGAGGTSTFRFIGQARPVAPYTVTAKFAIAAYNQNYQGAGIGFYDTSISKGVVMFLYTVAHTSASYTLNLAIAYMTSLTGFTTLPINAPIQEGYIRGYFRITDNGTNFVFGISPDNIVWNDFLTVSRTAYISTSYDKVGIGCYTDNSTVPRVSFDWFRRT